MTLKMTTAQVVETSVTVTNSSFQNYTHPDDHTTRTTVYCVVQGDLTFEAVDESLKCDHSNESSRAVFPFGAVYYAVQGGSNF